MKIIIFWIASMCSLIALFLLSYYMFINEAFAHVEKKFGNIQVQVGWSNEPPLTGLLNNVIVGVNQTNSKSNSNN